MPPTIGAESSPAAASAPITAEALHRSPNALAPHYSRFRVAEQLLLTGHSHQAWPDCSLEGQVRAWDDAVEMADTKWQRAFAMAEQVKAAYARLMDDRTGSYTLGANTHELVVRFLSALPLRDRPRLVTTDGEFHSIRRQLDRLAEEGVEIVRLPANDPQRLADGLIAAICDKTAAVLVSAVLFQNARIVPGLGEVAIAAGRHGAELLVDVYHALDAIPYSLVSEGLEGAFIVGGGYKYCQLGEGNCFLRVPDGCRMRPVITGWFAEFDVLSSELGGGRVAYGEGAARFAGATYDPTSHYRAARVFDFFTDMGLTPELLREVSQHQVATLAAAFERLDVDPLAIRLPAVPLAELGGFLALQTPHAEHLHQELRRRGVLTDYRADKLRFGPAPYLSDAQLRDSMGLLGEVIRESYP
ncbi:MAG: kynureninase [bacterium]|nr:kynureninase [bacterium]